MRGAADEYRADVLAAVVLRLMTHEDPRALEFDDVRRMWNAEQHFASLTAVLNDVVHPAWSETVEQVRVGVLDASSAWGVIVTQTDQLLTLLAHADAAAGMADQPRVLTGPLAMHVAVDEHVRDAWMPILAHLSTHVMPTGLPGFAADEHDLLLIGEDSVGCMWDLLGLKYNQDTAGSLSLFVAGGN